MESQKPSVGRIVHFHASPSSPAEAAIVSHVWSDVCINVSKCDPNGIWSSATSVLLEAPSGSFWRWPPRA